MLHNNFSSYKKLNALTKTFLLSSFLAVLLISCGSEGPDPTTVTDIDGNVYTVIRIGEQLWTVENLRTTRYNDGSSIPNIIDSTAWRYATTPGYCYYNNTSSIDTITKFGALYNWYCVKTKKLAPRGWHVPSNEEWYTLKNYLIANGHTSEGAYLNDEIAISLSAQTDWASYSGSRAPGSDLLKNNKSGFSALPGGYRFVTGKFFNIGLEGNWWSSTEELTGSAWSRQLKYSVSRFYEEDYPKEFGFSVRLVKDD